MPDITYEYNLKEKYDEENEITDDIILTFDMADLKEIIPELGIRKKFFAMFTEKKKQVNEMIQLSSEDQGPPPTTSLSNIGVKGQTVNVFGPLNVSTGSTSIQDKKSTGTSNNDNDPSSMCAQPVWFNVRDPIDSFSGREEFLEKLHATIQKGGLTVLSQVQVISGLGGVGKTETARKYIIKYGKSCYKNVIWVNAESRHTMRDSFLKLAEGQLHIYRRDEGPQDLEEVVTKVYEKICPFTTLMIFDNAEHYDDNDQQDNHDDHEGGGGIRPFLPTSLAPPLKKPFILVTSRRLNWFASRGSRGGSRHVIPLDVFSDDESITFILEQLPLVDSDDSEGEDEDHREDKNIESHRGDALKLGRLLGGLPLALQQAVAYIRKEDEIQRLLNPAGYKISDYINDFEERSPLLLNHPPDGSYNYRDSVTTTWTMTFEKIKAAGSETGSPATPILQILALLHSDAIPIKLLLALYPEEKHVDVSKSLLLLRSYAMVKIYAASASGGGGFVTIHRLVQHIILGKLMIDDLVLEVTPPFFQHLKSLPLSDPSYDTVLNNLLSLVNKFNMVRPPQATTPVADYRYELALAYTEFGNLDQAWGLLECQLDFEKKVLGQEHPNTLRTENQMGFLLRLQGKFSEALTLHEENYERINKFLGPHTPLMMTCMHNMAFAVQEQGRLSEAMELYKKAYEGRKKILGEDHEDCMGTLNNMANVHFWDGKYPEALELYRRVNDNRTKVLGPLNTLSIISLQNIANVFEAQGDYEEALKLFQKCWERWRETVGPNHRDTILALEGIAEIHRFQNRLEDAMAMCGQVHTFRKKHLGDHHPETLRVQSSIALILRDQGSHEQAMSLLEECYSGLRNSYGSSHSVSLEVQHHIATVMAAQGFLQEALGRLQNVYAAQVQNSGQGHPDSLDTQDSIADVLNQLGRGEEALKAYHGVFEGRKTVLGPLHPKTLLTKEKMDALRVTPCEVRVK